MIACHLERPLLFFEDGEFKRYEAGTPCFAVARDEIQDGAWKALLIASHERDDRTKIKSVVVKLAGQYRVLARSAVVTAAELEKRREATMKRLQKKEG